jgi:hypothetical protein
MMLAFDYTLPYGSSILKDNHLEEFFGDELEGLKHTLKCEEESTPHCGV